MWSTNVNTAWIQRSNTRLLCIITPFRLSPPANFRMARDTPEIRTAGRSPMRLGPP